MAVETGAESLAMPARKGSKPGEKGQRSWWDDVDVLNRVRRVHSLTEQKLTAAKIASLLEVSEATISVDRAHYLELAREDIKQDIRTHIENLDMIIDEATAAFHAISASTTFGVKRSDYLNIIRQAVMDKAKLDGSLNADPIQIGIQVNVGPAPNELYEQGKLRDEDYESHLRVLALQSGAQVIEGEVLSPVVEEGPREAVVRQRRPTSSPPKAGVAQAAPAPLLPEDPLLADFTPDPDQYDEEEDKE